MKFTSVLAPLCLSVLSVRAAPLKRDGAPTDTDILNYALTLEHLENAFYSGALAQFDDDAFNAAGLDRSLFKQIAAHEAQHVQFLSTALGDKATAPCNYSFPYTDIESFAGLAAVIEGVGVSAYLGAAGYISNKDYLTAAGSILTTEARHAAWIASSIGQEPWSGPEDTPLSLDDVYSIAAAFITGCPSSNPNLPVKAFPAVTVTSGTSVTPGSTLSLTFANSGQGSAYVAFFHGLTTTFAPYDASSSSVTVPSDVGSGTVYAVVTSQSSGAVTDDNTIAGPIILSVGTSDNDN